MPAEITQWKILSEDEQPAVLPLLAKCFPAYWEQVAAKYNRMPFDELSFAAIAEDGMPVGHVGIMEYSISDGKQGSIKMAGIASVCVDDAYRCRGIASRLCQMAIDWAQERQFASLPLYTDKSHVYAKSGWRDYETLPPRRAIFPEQSNDLAICYCDVCALPQNAQQVVSSIYDSGEVFLGKILRKWGHAFPDWPRIFSEPEFKIAFYDNAYALLWEGAVMEMFWKPGVTVDELSSFVTAMAKYNGNTLDIALPENSMAWTAVKACASNLSISPDNHMHGEHVMFYDLPGSCPHNNSQNIFYALTDKF